MLYGLFLQTAPTAEELGYCDMVRVDEIGDTPVIIFKQGTYHRHNITSLSLVLVLLVYWTS